MQLLEVTAKKEFYAIADLLNKYKIQWWLEWGSMLGAVRDGNVIKNDRDIDIGVNFIDSYKIKELMRNAGLAPPYFVDFWFSERVLLKGKYYRAHYLHHQGWKQPEGRMKVRFLFPNDFYEPFTRKIQFLGTECIVATKAEELLTYIYEDWHTIRGKYSLNWDDHQRYMLRKDKFELKQKELIKNVYRKVKGE